MTHRPFTPAGEAGFDICAPLVLDFEGGFVDHPRDPGGATCRGVTFKTFTDWRLWRGEPAPSVADLRAIAEDEARAIYRRGYWNVARCRDLPLALAFLVFDTAINSGPARGAKLLQAALKGRGENPGPIDGAIGPQTLAALARAPERAVIVEFCAQRAVFYAGLATFADFGLGWMRRNCEAEAEALALFARGLEHGAQAGLAR